MKRALLVLLASAMAAVAMSGTDELIGEYDPIEERPGWPEGVLELLQDPTRKVGWRPWFSELPNDGEFYAFAVRSTQDVQRLITTFAKIADPKKRVAFNPGRGPRGLGDFRANAAGREWGAILCFSNKNAVAHANDREAKSGKSPVYMARPAYLEIYLGTADINLLELKIPERLTVSYTESSPFPGRDYPGQVHKIREFKEKGFRK